MAALTTNSLSYTTGAKPTLVAAAATDTAEAPSGEGQIFVVYENTNASGRTITVTVPGTTEWDDPLDDMTYSLGATNGVRWIPLHPDWANSTGRVDLAVDQTAGVTVGVVRIH